MTPFIDEVVKIRALKSSDPLRTHRGVPTFGTAWFLRFDRVAGLGVSETYARSVRERR